MIRFLLDQGLPRSTVQHLAAGGFDVCHLADIGYSRATDAEISSFYERFVDCRSDPKNYQ